MVTLGKALQDFLQTVADMYLTRFKRTNHHKDLTAYINTLEKLVP